MEAPKYTELEQRLTRENRDLRDKVKRLDQELLDQISHTGAYVTKLKKKSEQAAGLIAWLELIEELAEGYDEHGATGPKDPLSWESVARAAFDYARAATSGRKV